METLKALSKQPLAQPQQSFVVVIILPLCNSNFSQKGIYSRVADTQMPRLRHNCAEYGIPYGLKENRYRNLSAVFKTRDSI